MADEQNETSSIKAHIEQAEEQTLGSQNHAQLEATENVVHHYIPVPLEIGLIVVILVLGVIFVITKLKSH